MLHSLQWSRRKTHMYYLFAWISCILIFDKKSYHIKKLNVYDPRFFSILNSLIYGYEQQCLICRYQHSIHSLLWINIVIGPFERTQTTIWKGTNYSYENQNYSWRIFIKVFSTPIKDRTQFYIHFIALKFHEHLWSYMYNAHKACHMEGYITQTTNILRIYVLVLSLHILAWFVCFQNVIKTLLHGFDPDICIGYRIFFCWFAIDTR